MVAASGTPFAACAVETPSTATLGNGAEAESEQETEREHVPAPAHQAKPVRSHGTGGFG